MRRHIYIGLTDRKLAWLEDSVMTRDEQGRFIHDIVDFYGHLFHVRKAPTKLGQYHVIEITNVRTFFPMKRLYRFFKRSQIEGVAGPFTLKQLSAMYPNYVRRWFTDGKYDMDGNWTPGPNLVPLRQIAGDPHPTIQAQFEYNPSDEDCLVDEIPGERDDPDREDRPDIGKIERTMRLVSS